MGSLTVYLKICLCSLFLWRILTRSLLFAVFARAELILTKDSTHWNREKTWLLLITRITILLALTPGLLRCFPSGRLCYGASRLSLTVHQTPKHAWWAFHYISFLLLHTPHSVTLRHEIYIIFNQSTYTIHCTCLYCCSRLLVTL